MHDCVQTAVNRTTVVINIAQVHFSWTFLILCDVDGVGDQLVNSLVLGCGNRDHRDSEHFLHLVDHDGTTVGSHFVHHV